jgi:hypothetical protein
VSQTQMFSAMVNELRLSAQLLDDGKLHVRTSLRLGSAPVEHTHDTYPACLDDELHTVLDCHLGALFVRATAAAAGDFALPL